MVPVGLSAPYQFTQFFSKGSQFISNVAALASSHFKVMESMGLTSMGMKEIAFDAVPSKQQTKAFYIVHGALFIGSGLASALVAANQYGLIAISKWVQFVSLTGNGLFLTANLLALYHYVETYRKAQAMEGSINPQEQALAERMKYSSVMGIINSLGYLMAPIATFLGAPLPVVMIFCSIALATGCLKILYDYVCVKQNI